jgi:transcriptional regulator with XRE-family HTH domain
VLGARIAQLRSAARLTQAQVADAMDFRGIGWNRSTVAQLETGRRSLSFVEALGLAGVFRIPIDELINFEEDVVQVGEGLWRRSYFAALMLGEADERTPIGRGFSSPASERERESIWRAGADLPRQLAVIGAFTARWDVFEGDELRRLLESVTDLEERAARRASRRTGLTAEGLDIAAAAERLWGRSLGAERDRRVDADPRSSGARMTTLQALRGHVMRALDIELAEALEAAATRAAQRPDSAPPVGSKFGAPSPFVTTGTSTPKAARPRPRRARPQGEDQ